MMGNQETILHVKWPLQILKNIYLILKAEKPSWLILGIVFCGYLLTNDYIITRAHIGSRQSDSTDLSN